MRFSVLASGSTGNAFFIGTDRCAFLVDAGLSGKQVEKLLDSVGVKPTELNGILVTHEHNDHIKGVGVLARKYQLPVYANEATWARLPALIGEVPEKQQEVFRTNTQITLGDLDIQSYGISHDAAEPVGFCFYHGIHKLALTTDLGYVSQRIKETILGADIFVFESNHDVELLRMGSYPWHIKQRILSDSGHLSNEDAGEALLHVITERTKQVYLAHLSKENNMVELAHMTVNNILSENGIKVNHDLQLLNTSPVHPTPMVRLDKGHALRVG
jgi:phosphoribosyl 1,2-cyclic phosphodiesterase